jgi:DNA-directed RNA polymerase specialized sigma24 family protein
MSNESISEKITFESQIDFIKSQIAKRKHKWSLSTLDWEDVESMLLARVYLKFHLYDEKQPLEHWVNRVISNFIKNLLRDNLTKFIRPCVLNCIYNLGGTACGYTKSGTQCGECKLYANWQHKKESQFNIKASLPLENHSQEINNKQSDFIDIEKAKKIIDEKIKEKLDRREKKIYRLLYIEYMTAQEASDFLVKENSKLYEGESYAKILEFQKKIIRLSKEIIEDEDLVN